MTRDWKFETYRATEEKAVGCDRPYIFVLGVLSRGTKQSQRWSL